MSGRRHWKIRVTERNTGNVTESSFARKGDADLLYVTLINTIDGTKVKSIEIINPRGDIEDIYNF